jgi:hypothetical protein
MVEHGRCTAIATGVTPFQFDIVDTGSQIFGS